MNAALPCKLDGALSSHKVENVCAGGVSTDVWVERISQSLHEDTAMRMILHDADVIMVETSVNDVNELVKKTKNNDVGDPDLRIKRYTEILINLLLSLPNNPSVIFIGASSRGTWHGAYPRTTDAVHAQLGVTKKYGLPHISAIDGLGPFNTHVATTWFENVYRVDVCCHVTSFGHRIIAHLAMNLLLQHYWSITNPIMPDFYSSFRKTPLLHVKQTDIDMFLYSRPLYVSTIGGADQPHRLSASPGWDSFEDVKGKPGLIANQTGARVRFFLNKKDVIYHVNSGVFHITFLKSYQHMGVALVELHAAKQLNGTCRSQSLVAIATKIIDCLWEKHVSEVEVDEISFEPNITSGSCLLITVTVKPSAPARDENKIKMLGFTVY
jgi:hypothetical protein